MNELADGNKKQGEGDITIITNGENEEGLRRRVGCQFRYLTFGRKKGKGTMYV